MSDQHRLRLELSVCGQPVGDLPVWVAPLDDQVVVIHGDGTRTLLPRPPQPKPAPLDASDVFSGWIEVGLTEDTWSAGR